MATTARRAHRGIPLPAGAARTRADAARNSELVVDAALASFDELGTLASMDEIARRAGVGKATVYRCFPSRDALMGAIAARQLEDTRQLALAALESDASAAEALVGYTRAIFAYGCAHRLLLQMYRVGQLLPLIEEERAGGRKAMATLLNRCRRAGALRDGVTNDDYFLVVVALTTQLAVDPASRPRHWRRGADMVLTTILAEPPPR